MRMLQLGTLLLGLTLAGSAAAAVKTETVHYRDGDQELQGYVAWDDAKSGKRPGVLVVHEWWGLNDYARERARKLAELGYVAFAVDMYGPGKVTTHPKEAGAWSSAISTNQAAWQQRALAGLSELRKRPQVDGSRVAAIGYCFGGSTVMQMAYAGADLKGVASFHGALPVASEAEAKKVHASVFAAHGKDDAFVPTERVLQFQEALDKAGVDWRMTIYGGTRHGFTNPDADSYGIDNLKYNPAADRRSWAELQRFFGEIFK